MAYFHGHVVFVPHVSVPSRSLPPDDQLAMLDAYYILVVLFEDFVEFGCRGVGYPR
jgi:hypothetical protein